MPLAFVKADYHFWLVKGKDVGLVEYWRVVLFWSNTVRSQVHHRRARWFPCCCSQRCWVSSCRSCLLKAEQWDDGAASLILCEQVTRGARPGS